MLDDLFTAMKAFRQIVSGEIQYSFVKTLLFLIDVKLQ